MTGGPAITWTTNRVHGLGASTGRRASPFVRITPSRSDASPISYVAHEDAGSVTNSVHHHLFGWYAPMAFEGVSRDAAVTFESRSSGSSPCSWTPRGGGAYSPSSSSVTAWSSPRGGGSYSSRARSPLPADVRKGGDVHGRIVAGARNKQYYMPIAAHDRPSVPEHIRLQRIRRVVDGSARR